MQWTEEEEKPKASIEADTVYPFEVVDAEERTSQKGNDYISLKLQVFLDESNKTIYDIIMPSFPSKLRAFCEVAGLIDRFHARTLAAIDCVGKSGHLRTKKKPSDKGYYEVETYVAAPSGQAIPLPDPPGLQGTKRRTIVDDEDKIPF